jgi:hypothetical protein
MERLAAPTGIRKQWQVALHAIEEEHRFSDTIDIHAAVALQACIHDLRACSSDRLGGLAELAHTCGTRSLPTLSV